MMRNREQHTRTEERHTNILDFASLRTQEQSLMRRLNHVIDRLPPEVRKSASALAALFMLTTEGCMHRQAQDPQAEIEEMMRAQMQPAEKTVEGIPLPALDPEQLTAEIIATNEKWESAFQEYHALLKECAAAGFEFTPEFMLSMHPGIIGSLEHDQRFKLQIYNSILEIALMQQGAQLFGMGSSPLIYHSLHDISKLEQPTELQDRSKPIRLNPYQVSFQRLASGETTVVVVNWLTKKIIYGANIEPLTRQPMDVAEVSLQQFAQDAFQAIQQDAQSQPERIEQLKTESRDTAVRKPVYEFLGSEPHSDIESLAQNFSSISFHVVGFDRAIDRPNLFSIDIDAAFLEKSGERPIESHGSIESIFFHTDYTPEDPEFQSVVTAEPAFAVDAYGNVIIKQSIKTFKGAGVVSVDQSIVVYPPTAFDDTAGPEGTVTPVSIDLSVVGIPLQLEDYFHQPVERPIATMQDGAYGVYTTMDHEKVKTEYGETFPEITAAMKRAEELWGVDAGEAAKRVLIVNSQDPNAHFDPRDPNVIVLRDEIFGGHGMEITAFHETTHLLDHHFGLTEDVGLMQLHVDLSVDFFNAINETQWFPGHDGGHSQENVAEFLASFLNTVADAEWETKIQSLSPSVRSEYLQALHTLQAAFQLAAEKQPHESEMKGRTVHQLNAQAPIHRLLEHHIQFLQQ